MCWCGQVNTQGVNLLLGWLGDGDNLGADSLKWCRAGVLINPLPIISYLRSIIQILHMHQSGHTGAGQAPGGSPGVSWLNGVYRSCCSKCNVCWIQQGVCYTLRWLTVCLLLWLHWCWGCSHNVGQPRFRVSGLPPGSCQAIMYQRKMETTGTIGVSGTSGLPQVGVKQLSCGGTLLAR